ncbi:hypothetical protein RR48_02017 [Papilio machaon]|uniref:Uncharacterized protein n=1 Tax=Papilio machaon TaxID=76193 RepID=A0A0N1PIU5_PAPMA|nr:hypothetical protein RR48_02017 [Papilio machaon]
MDSSLLEGSSLKELLGVIQYEAKKLEEDIRESTARLCVQDLNSNLLIIQHSDIYYSGKFIIKNELHCNIIESASQGSHLAPSPPVSKTHFDNSL